MPAFLAMDWLLPQLGRQRRQAQVRYGAFVQEGMDRPGPWEHVRGPSLLGEDAFVGPLQAFLK